MTQGQAAIVGEYKVGDRYALNWGSEEGIQKRYRDRQTYNTIMKIWKLKIALF